MPYGPDLDDEPAEKRVDRRGDGSASGGFARVGMSTLINLPLNLTLMNNTALQSRLPAMIDCRVRALSTATQNWIWIWPTFRESGTVPKRGGSTANTHPARTVGKRRGAHRPRPAGPSRSPHRPGATEIQP